MGIIKFIKKSIKYLYRETVLYAIWHFSSFFPYFPTLMLSKIRPKTWKWLGAEIGKGCLMGYGIYLDVSSMKRLHVGNNVFFSSQCLILLHRRDLSKYYQGMSTHDIPMKEYHIYIEDNVQIGMRAMIMPGVRLGKGCVVGANSIVTKDVAPYTVVAGQPAKVIKEITKPLEK